MAEQTFAFKCKHCGNLEPLEAAGDNDLPSACRICRHGVKFEMSPDGTGFSVILDPDNWEVIGDAPRKGKSAPQGARIEAAAKERVGSRDKA